MLERHDGVEPYIKILLLLNSLYFIFGCEITVIRNVARLSCVTKNIIVVGKMSFVE